MQDGGGVIIPCNKERLHTRLKDMVSWAILAVGRVGEVGPGDL